MPDSAAVDSAIVAKLLADTAAGGVMTYATDGVFIDEAAQTSKHFVIVSLVDEHDEQQFGNRAYEESLYLVKFVDLSTSSSNAKAAAARIDALLDPGGAGGSLTVSGFTLMTMYRDSRLVPQVEVDEVDASLRWQHRGANYRVVVSG